MERGPQMERGPEIEKRIYAKGIGKGTGALKAETKRTPNCVLRYRDVAQK